VANPLIMTFFHFKTKEAIAISSFTILISAVARFIYCINERNPKKPFVVLVDYGLASVMMPATLAGAQVGVIFFYHMPAIVIESLLTLLLIFLLF
jgi:uncharacterized membrane protein YfcA